MQEDKRYSDTTVVTFSQAISLFLQEQNLITDDLQDQYEQIVYKLLDLIIPMVLKEVSDITTTTTGAETDPRWMIEIANRAVEDNIQENGIPKYNSAQGFACALSAIKMMAKYLPSKEKASIIKTDPEQKEVILNHARELYDHVKEKFGEQSAAKQVVIYIAEQYGVVDWNEIGILPNEKEELLQMVISQFDEQRI